MKTILLSSMLCAAVLSTSCSTTNYYQLYKASPQTSMAQSSALVYEDANCTVTYNLWGESGNAGFKFSNKTNEAIFINLSESYFILNGIAYDYFKNRIVTESSGQTISQSKKTTVQMPVYNNFFWPIIGAQSVSASAANTSSYSVAYTETKIVAVPPKTAKVFSEYYINKEFIKDCSLPKYPSKKQVQPVTFSNTDSPLVFSNRISYSVGTGNAVKFENAFYVSEISNHPGDEFITQERIKECGETVNVRTFNHKAANSFYVSYLMDKYSSKY